MRFVCSHRGISRYKSHLFYRRLCEQHPVEWVTVMKGELVESVDMPLIYIKKLKLSRLDLLGDNLFERHIENQFTELRFDLDLPEAGSPQVQDIIFVSAYFCIHTSSHHTPTLPNFLP